ncbi:hypothetical protein QE152_g27529 [Popillia japonica]|uniref:Uncharacterized protein n=1 Tax=Popillia japonica TaxID=7064 RepID=A0AAW1JW05_POPJA
MPSAVTDQPPPAADCNPQEDPSTAASGDQCATKEVVEAFRQPTEASTSTASEEGDDFQDLALKSLRPLPKAALRISTRKGRKQSAHCRANSP